jgi:hypothetical protein
MPSWHGSTGRITQAAREERSLPVTGTIAAALDMLPVG